MDRLLGFYEGIFDARVTFDRVEEVPPRRRHAFIEIGPDTVLHPFEVEGVQPPEREPTFGRGRLDHFALNAASEETFRGDSPPSDRRGRERHGSAPEGVQRAVAAGHPVVDGGAQGGITHFGSLYWGKSLTL
jgi:hypothetical protein